MFRCSFGVSHSLVPCIILSFSYLPSTCPFDLFRLFRTCLFWFALFLPYFTPLLFFSHSLITSCLNDLIHKYTEFSGKLIKNCKILKARAGLLWGKIKSRGKNKKSDAESVLHKMSPPYFLAWYNLVKMFSLYVQYHYYFKTFLLYSSGRTFMGKIKILVIF